MLTIAKASTSNNTWITLEKSVQYILTALLFIDIGKPINLTYELLTAWAYKGTE